MTETTMKRLSLIILLAAVPVQPSIRDVSSSSVAPWHVAGAIAQPSEVSAREAFEAAKELGTTEAWEAFLASFPTGFYADLARAYIKKRKEDAERATTSAPVQGRQPATSEPAPQPPASGAANARASANPDTGFDLGDVAPTDPGKPAALRGGRYMGFPEKFNRYYTDPTWRPTRVLYVNPDGRGNGASRDTPTSVRTAINAARPGTQIFFLRGNYQGCFEFTKERSGTYDNPIVLYGERNEDKSVGVTISCCGSGRQTCFNFEEADYIAVDGFELVGGQYGVRALGAGYAASEHSSGIAVLNCKGHDQDKDPFFSGQSDWAVWERNIAYGAKEGDGHGIYLSNGGDWNIVRFNETYGNVGSDFQINPGPNELCKEEGIEFTDPRCDAYAVEGEGGRGASDYFLVDSNYFHHGTHGANFTSVRRSVIRNNIFGLHTPRHGVSFWQETDNPRLGSSDNKVVHNLFITTGRQAVQFINQSTRNEFVNNVILGVQISGSNVTANPRALLMEVDDTVSANEYGSNLYVAGRIVGRTPNARETARADFSPGWFAKFPAAMNHDPNDFTPTSSAPFLATGQLSRYAPSDRNGAARAGKVDLGPINATERAESSVPLVQAAQPPPTSVPRAVTVARTTTIPRCTVFVDAAATGRGDATIQRPHRTITAAVAAADIGAVICVTEGTYAEQIKPGEKSFTLAGGFQRGFKVRDSARHATRAVGRGGSFIRIEDPGPKGNQATVIDGFDISGYAQAIYREHWESQRFEITNNYIHDNHCQNHKLSGGGFHLQNISGRIEGNVIRNNSCGRGGGGWINDNAKQNTVTIERNLIEGNAGTDPEKSHGGGLELSSRTLRLNANLFLRNTVTRWGAGLTIGAWTEGGEHTTATLNWNVYRSNRAGIAGGGMFCDDGATCRSFHEIYDSNCGGNIFLDAGGGDPTRASFTHLTNVGALDAACREPGPGVHIVGGEKGQADDYSFVNAIFWGNARGRDFVANCDYTCDKVRIAVSYAMVQTQYVRSGGMTVRFGDGIMAPVDPLFADPANGDFHLKSTAGRWTPQGYVRDPVVSPAIAKGYPPDGPAEQNPERAGRRSELGAYGNSGEASYVR